MSFVDGIWHRLHVLLRGESYAREVERELRFHGDLDGLSREKRDAESAARPTLGNVTYYREEVRRMTLLDWSDRVRQDASYAWRGLVRTPVFTATVIATLGLGIGVNSAMYSFLDHLFLRAPGGVVEPNGVRRLYLESSRNRVNGGPGTFASFSYPRFDAVRQRVGDSIPLAAFTPSSGGLLTANGKTDSTRVSYVEPAYFAVLRLRPALGRFFAPDEAVLDVPASVAVISDALWRRRFAGDPGILGRVIEVKDKRVTVIGVAPPRFVGVELNLVEVWLPLSSFPAGASDGRPWYRATGNYVRALGRVSSAPLEARLIAAGSAAVRDNPNDLRPDTTMRVRTGSIIEARGPVASSREVSVSTRLAGVTAIVLLIACANVVNMLLLRTSSRHREIAVRRALGVSRWRLHGQLIVESALLGVLSGGAASALAVWTGTALRRLILPTIHWASPPVDSKIVLVTLTTAFVIGFVAGVFPAAFATKVDLANALKTGGGSRTARRSRIQAGLLATQAAFSVVLLVAAGLFVRTLSNVRSIDLGYDLNGLLVTNTFIHGQARERDIGVKLVGIADRLRATPGVSSIALSSTAPMVGYAIEGVYLPGRDSVVKVRGEFPTHFKTTPGYFAASGARVLAGRDFHANDRVGTTPVVVVSQSMARALWPSESPIGKCVIIGRAKNSCTTVVGVAEDVHRSNIIEAVGAQYYLPLAQHPDDIPTSIVLRVRDGARSNAVAVLREELTAILPNPSDFAIRPMDQIIQNDLRPWRMGAILVSALGTFAIVVAALGIYGVVAYAMSQRTHEIGVRIALGARSSDIVDLVVGESMRTVAVGIAVGLIVALLLGKVVASLLFGVTARDPSTFLFACAVLCAVGVMASLIPAWRAARVDPVTSLRVD